MAEEEDILYAHICGRQEGCDVMVTEINPAVTRQGALTLWLEAGGWPSPRCQWMEIESFWEGFSVFFHGKRISRLNVLRLTGRGNLLQTRGYCHVQMLI